MSGVATTCSARLGGRWVPLAAVALGVLPALAALDSRSFFSPDEANYAQVAREMLERRDFLVPHRDGQVWLNKPPLAHWLLAAGFALVGWGFAAAVLVNSLLTAVTGWLVARHAGRDDPLAGLLAGAVYLTMFLPLFVARSALTDAALTACTTASVVCFLAATRGSAVAAGVFLGLGMLAKGPVAPVVVVPAMLVTVARGERRRALTRVGVAVAVSLAMVVPWLAALAVRGVLGTFASEFLGHEVLSRAVDDWPTTAPFWAVVPVLWAGLFPWGTHLLLAVSPSGTAGRRWQELPDLAEVAAVAVPVAIFAAARGKLPHYLLPVLPFLAMWLGRAMAGRWRRPADPWERGTAVAAGLLGSLPVVGVARFLVAHPVREFLPPSLWPGLAAVALGMAAAGALGWRGLRAAAFVTLAAVGLGARLFLDVGIFPALEAARVDRPVAEAVARRLSPGGVPIAHRWYREAYLAYGPRGWWRTAGEEDLAAALEAARRAGRVPLVVASGASEGEVRGVAWRQGGEARELFRFRGLVERHFMPVVVAGFAIAPERSGERFFCDFDGDMPGAGGFWGPEGHRHVRSYRWTAAATAELPVSLPATPWVVRVRGWGLAREGVPQTLGVSLDGCSLGVVELAEEAREFALSSHPCPARGGSGTVTLSVRHLLRPRDVVPGSEDGRLLGAALDWLAIDPARPEIVLGGGAGQEPDRPSPTVGGAGLHRGFTPPPADLHPVAPR